jgi:uroporphyrinogen decarboxylase
MPTALTSRERVSRMFERRDHDRVPRHESFWSDTIERWQREGLVGDQQTVLDKLQSDFCGLNWLWPQAYPGEERTVEQDETTRVVRDGNGRMGTPEHLGFECDSREKWEQVFKPALLSTGLQCDPNAVARAFKRGREQGKWCHLTGVEGFEETRSLMGDEITLMAMAEDPEWVQDVSRTFTNVMIRNLDAMMAVGIEPDGLWIYGDMAFKTATMCSPAMYRELIWPDHKRLADWAHVHNMKFIFHTDGDINGVMDLYVQAGFDCIQPLEVKASMDVRTLIPKYHRDLAFFGNIDVMAMATNDLPRIEAEIESKLAVGKEYRCYAYHSDHSVPPSVSWETYQAIIAMVEKHGQYA